ncbi:MAG: hypothetical protein WC657_00925 [Candidatus Paceibacterota bacterium]|jgi:hypothetical protein
MSNESPQNPQPQYPEGYENWPQDDKEAFVKLKEKLADAGIKIQIVEAQMNQGMYNEDEKIFKIRQDANDVDYLTDCAENSIFKEQDGVDQLPDPGQVEDIHEDQEEETEKEDDEVEENRVFGGEKDDGSIDNKVSPEPAIVSAPAPAPASTPELQTEPNTNPTIEESGLEGEKLDNFLKKIGIAFFVHGDELENFKKLYPGLLAEKYKEIREAFEAFSGNETLREKFSTVVLTYPKELYYPKVSIEQEIRLYVDLRATKEDISDYLNNLPAEVPGSPEPGPSEIKEALGKNGETIKVGDKVEWDSFTGEGVGMLVSFEKTPGSHIKAIIDIGSDRQMEVYADELSIVKDNPEFGAVVLRLVEEGTEKEKLFVSLDEIKSIISIQLGQSAKIEELNLSETTEGLQLMVKLNAGMMGGKISMEGKIVNIGNDIAVQDLNIQARGYVKSQIESNVASFSSIIKTYFEKQKGKSVSGLQISGSGLVVEFENKKALKPTAVTSESDIPPAAVSTGENQPGNGEEWQNWEDWTEFEKTRARRAKGEVEHSQISEIIDGIYKSQKNNIAKKIEETLRKNAGENLTPEQELELRSKINDKIFEELVQKENEAYLTVLKEARGETKMGKVLEGAKSLLSTKAVQWYLGLSKTQRIGVSLAIGGFAGFAIGGATIGALGVGGYLGKRALTAVTGAGMGELVNKKKSWSLEEINKNEAEEIEGLKKSDFDLEKKSEKSAEIDKKYKKARLKAAAWKFGLTVAAGAGTSLLANLAEGAFVGVGSGGATKSALESKGGKSAPIQERLPRKGFEPGQKTASAPEGSVSKTTESVEPTKSSSPRPAEAVMPEPQIVARPIPFKEVPTESVVIKTPAVLEMSEPSAPEPVVLEKIFDNPEVLIHEVKAGDSTWNILKETLNNNEQFKGLTEAQQTYVLSSLTNKVLQNPQDYGLGDEGAIQIGDKTDFTKLFENTKEVNAIFEKASQTITAGGPQEVSILANNAKIANWVNAHPNEALTEDKVTEILSTKEILRAKYINMPMPEVATEPSVTQTPEVLEFSKEPDILPEALGTPEAPLGKPTVDMNPGETVMAGTGLAAMGLLNKNNRNQLEEEIRQAKDRLGVLEGGRAKNPNLERTMMSDSKFNQELEMAFLGEIDSIYGKSGLLGIGRTPGIKTKEWAEMAKIPAVKLVEYYTGDSTKAGLAPDIIKKLTMKNHQTLMRQMAGLMEQSNGAVKPFENENVEQFIRRLGGYVLRTHSQNLAKAA